MVLAYHHNLAIVDLDVDVDNQIIARSAAWTWTTLVPLGCNLSESQLVLHHVTLVKHVVKFPHYHYQRHPWMLDYRSATVGFARYDT
jgi:hypothetical protein